VICDSQPPVALQVFRQLTCYRDAIQFVHDQTVRLMNMGMHPVEIAKNIQLPPSLASQPFLKVGGEGEGVGQRREEG
jgi:alkyl sulfatase BDS1-like metallo-beta-lactamase superfamily hydrolase